MADAAFSQSAIEVREGRRRAATGADERRQPASVQQAVATPHVCACDWACPVVNNIMGHNRGIFLGVTPPYSKPRRDRWP